jgi:SAM-dependent MidA family methyltransferase
MTPLEAPVRFSQSKIWAMQQAYFKQTGIDAWRNAQVTHYITSNPFIARKYANMIMAFFADRRRLGKTDEKVYLLELGAGSGRFSYHLLKELEQLQA